MFPEPTELLLIGCLVESIWTQEPNHTHWHQEPTRRHTDKGKFHTWWMESSCVLVQRQPFQFHQQRQSDVEKNKRRCRWRKSHSKIKADDEFGIKMPCKGSDRTCLDCIWKAGEHPIWKSESTCQLVKCAANKYGETRIGRQLIRLLRMKNWRQVIFSSVDTWWNVEHKYGKTRIWQVCHRWWYELWHRRRIGPFCEITVIPEQSQWPIVKDAGPFSKRFNARRWQTFYDLVNVYVFDIGSICVHGNELLRQFTFHRKYSEQSHFEADVRDVWTVDIGTIGLNFWSLKSVG